MSSNEWFADRSFWADYRSHIWGERRISTSGSAVGYISQLLGMQDSESVLDLACGFGRHSIEFGKLGLSVTGVDLNPDLINEAIRNASEYSFNCRFILADMREFSEPSSFDYAVLLFNSFGYFRDPNDDKRVVSNCFKSLHPGGKLLISITGRKVLKRNMNSNQKRYWRENKGVFVLEEYTVDEGWSWLTIKWITLDGPEKKSVEYGFRIYNEQEMFQLLSDEGFIAIRSFGNYKGSDYDDEAKGLVVIAEKPS